MKQKTFRRASPAHRTLFMHRPVQMKYAVKSAYGPRIFSQKSEILGILDLETGKIIRPFSVSSRSFFHGVPSEKINLMT